jgi:hypothetical protein
LPKHQTWRERSVDAAWGSHGPRFPPARHDAASSMGRRRRGALGNWRLEGTPTNRDKARRRRKGEGWPRRSQRVGGVVVAGLAWAAARRRCRCSRWRPAPVRLLLGHVRRLPRPAPRVLVTPRWRRAGGSAAHRPSQPLHLFFYLPPFLFPFGGAALEGGKTPMWVGGGGQLLLALLPLLLNPRRRKAWRKPSSAPAGSAQASVAAPPAPSQRLHGHKVAVRG